MYQYFAKPALIIHYDKFQFAKVRKNRRLKAIQKFELSFFSKKVVKSA